MKKILLVDDSALMRRVLCDIINSDEAFEVADRATNGLEALELLKKSKYDAVVLDVNMPKMNGLQLLNELRKNKIHAKVMMASTDTSEGAQTTLDALELGALDFVHKPDAAVSCKDLNFQTTFLQTLHQVCEASDPTFARPISAAKEKQQKEVDRKLLDMIQKKSVSIPGTKIVALASSTGGPKALQSVIPQLPANLDAPMVIVQHMPKGFTASLAERLDNMSDIKVCEAKEGDILKKGTVYISAGGFHMNVIRKGDAAVIHYTDEPIREGVKPCSNYMFESIMQAGFDQCVAVVLTGMGADGTEGIKNLKESGKVKLHVISQDQETSTIYGMPKMVYLAGLSNQVLPLSDIPREIIMHVGISKS